VVTDYFIAATSDDISGAFSKLRSTYEEGDVRVVARQNLPPKLKDTGIHSIDITCLV